MTAVARGLAGAASTDAIEESLRGRYRLEKPLDASGARRVCAAVDNSTGDAVVVKLGRPRRASESEDAVLARLRREADALRQLDGDGVPRLVAFNERPPWLAIQHIDGIDLERRLSVPTPLTERQIIALCAKLAKTLSALHARGLLHADIKPSNILLREDGTPILLDFGSARHLGAAEDEAAEDWSTTPEYAPPEFHTAQAALGVWSDIYALGAVAYRVIAGRPPVPAAVRLLGAAMPSTGEAAQPAISDELAALVDWALELDPAARPLSAEEWQQGLRQIAEECSADAGTVRVRRRAQAERRDGPRAKAARPARRISRRWKLAAAAIAVAAVAPLAWREARALYESRFKQEWVVGANSGGDTSSLADALLRAREGAVIRVRPGTYREAVAVARPVELLGIVENGEQPIVASADGACVLVTAPARIAQIALPCVDVLAGQASIESARIDGATVRGGAELRLVDTALAGGVLATGGASLTISGGEVRGAARSGVIARGGAALHVSGTQIVDNGEAGVLLAEGATARIEYAAVADSGTSGIEIRSGAQATIADSTLARASQAGIFVDGGSAEIDRTTVTNSGLSGLIVAAAGAAQVGASTFEQNGEHGLLVLDNARASVSGSRIAGNGGHGIALERGATAELGDNVVERNREPQVLDTRRPDAPDRRRGGAS
jgi:tRNA A-37 threonylcarbamoyl transferase component Bud32